MLKLKAKVVPESQGRVRSIVSQQAVKMNMPTQAGGSASDVVTPVVVVHVDLGVTFDSELTMRRHVNKVASVCSAFLVSEISSRFDNLLDLTSRDSHSRLCICTERTGQLQRSRCLLVSLPSPPLRCCNVHRTQRPD